MSLSFEEAIQRYSGRAEQLGGEGEDRPFSRAEVDAGMLDGSMDASGLRDTAIPVIVFSRVDNRELLLRRLAAVTG